MENKLSCILKNLSFEHEGTKVNIEELKIEGDVQCEPRIVSQWIAIVKTIIKKGV